MNTYIVLLKGINVGGHKKVPMAELRELLSKLGFENVHTYIQSGNVILQSLEKNTLKIEETIKNAMLDYFGFVVSVLVISRPNLKRVFDNSQKEKRKRAIL